MRSYEAMYIEVFIIKKIIKKFSPIIVILKIEYKRWKLDSLLKVHLKIKLKSINLEKKSY